LQDRYGLLPWEEAGTRLMAGSKRVKELELGASTRVPEGVILLKEGSLINFRVRVCPGREYKEGAPWKI